MNWTKAEGKKQKKKSISLKVTSETLTCYSVGDSLTDSIKGNSVFLVNDFKFTLIFSDAGSLSSTDVSIMANGKDRRFGFQLFHSY